VSSQAVVSRGRPVPSVFVDSERINEDAPERAALEYGESLKSSKRLGRQSGRELRVVGHQFVVETGRRATSRGATHRLHWGDPDKPSSRKQVSGMLRSQKAFGIGR
jgi:hypothetical protein